MWGFISSKKCIPQCTLRCGLNVLEHEFSSSRSHIPDCKVSSCIMCVLKSWPVEEERFLQSTCSIVVTCILQNAVSVVAYVFYNPDLIVFQQIFQKASCVGMPNMLQNVVYAVLGKMFQSAISVSVVRACPKSRGQQQQKYVTWIENTVLVECLIQRARSVVARLMLQTES